MERAAENLQSQPNAAKPESRTAASGLLQRKCACGGGGSPGLAGECGECGKKRLRLQRFSISGQLTTNSRPAHGHAANHHAMHNDAASNHAARAQAANKRATGRQSANVNGAEQAEPAAAVSPIV
ncbi:MAG: hypothetical protein ACRD9R_20440, partial [Pyrinomonadaceae bacterium]